MKSERVIKSKIEPGKIETPVTSSVPTLPPTIETPEVAPPPVVVEKKKVSRK